MGMMECLLVGLPFENSIHGGVHIPKRKRSSSSAEPKPEEGASISMLEAAEILLAMANGGYCRDDVIQAKNPKKQRKRRRKEIELPASSTPEMPAAMRDRIVEMGGYEIQMVIQKQLQDTDMNKNQGRLILPAKKVRMDFVTEEEGKMLDDEESEDDHNNNNNNTNKKKKNKKKKGMEVMIMNHLLQESSIWLKKWKNGSRKVYCLMTNWNSFVEQTELRTGDSIQLWSFRTNFVHPQTGFLIAPHRLRFAIVKL